MKAPRSGRPAKKKRVASNQNTQAQCRPGRGGGWGAPRKKLSKHMAPPTGLTMVAYRQASTGKLLKDWKKVRGPETGVPRIEGPSGRQMMFSYKQGVEGCYFVEPPNAMINHGLVFPMQAPLRDTRQGCRGIPPANLLCPDAMLMLVHSPLSVTMVFW